MCNKFRENVSSYYDYFDHGFSLHLPEDVFNNLPQIFSLELYDNDNELICKHFVTIASKYISNLDSLVKIDLLKNIIYGYLFNKLHQSSSICVIKIDKEKYEVNCDSSECLLINFDFKHHGFFFNIPCKYHDGKLHVISLYDKQTMYRFFMSNVIISNEMVNTVIEEEYDPRNPILSIIVPVYNVEKYIKECLTSILNQTFNNFEILVVDDGSFDSSGMICDDFAAIDPRIKVVHTKNSGTFNSRRTGILGSSGKYITFIDSDDFYTSNNSLEFVINLIVEKKVDILQFYCDVVSDCSATANTLKALNKTPVDINGSKNIIESCFLNSAFSYNLWNKVYEGKIVRHVAKLLDECLMPSSQDAYLFFYIAYFSNSFSLIETQPIYTYRIGNGLSTKRVLPFERFCQVSDDYKIIERHVKFLKNESTYDYYRNFIYEYKKKIVLYPCQILCRIPRESMVDGFDLLCEKLPVHLLVRGLFFTFRNNLGGLADIINSSKYIRTHRFKHKIKNIALYFPHYIQGGVERVISLQIPIFKQIADKVFLITDYIDENEYELPPDVKRIVIDPNCEAKRYEVFSQVLTENSIDLIIYHALSSRSLIFDILLFKLLNVKVVGLRHELTYQTFGVLDDKPSYYHKIYRNLDKLVVLARTEEVYFNIMGCNPVYIPNIVQFSNKPKVTGASKIIIWLGRFHQNQKNYFDPVIIISKVVKKFPDVRLLMLGREEEIGSYDRINKYAEDNGLSNNIMILGSVSNVEKYYSQSSIHLMTSSYETFPMVMIESKSFGLPLVTYSMPYLELLRNGGGFIEVEQGNTDAAADALILLLQDRSLWCKFSNESYKSLEYFKSFNQYLAWKKVVYEVSHNSKNNFDLFKKNLFFDKKSMKIFFESMFFHYVKGCEKFSVLKKEYDLLAKYRKIKVDFINQGCIERIQILSTYPNALFKKLCSPRWLPKGAIIESVDGYFNAKLQVYGDGEVIIKIGGADIRNPNGGRYQIYITINNLIINNKKLISKPLVVSWDNAYTYKINVTNLQIFTIGCSWTSLT